MSNAAWEAWNEDEGRQWSNAEWEAWDGEGRQWNDAEWDGEGRQWSRKRARAPSTPPPRHMVEQAYAGTKPKGMLMPKAKVKPEGPTCTHKHAPYMQVQLLLIR